MQDHQRLPRAERLQLCAAEAPRQPIDKVQYQADHARVALQAQLDKIGDPERVGHRLGPGGEALPAVLDCHLWIGQDILEPIRLHAARRGDDVLAIDPLELQRRDARQARFAPGGGEQQDKTSRAEAAPQGRDQAGVERLEAVVEGGGHEEIIVPGGEIWGNLLHKKQMDTSAIDSKRGINSRSNSFDKN